MKRFSLFLAVSLLFSSGAFAAQNNCMRRYAGQWSWVSSTGIATLHAFGEDGSANCYGNPFCVRSESWSCNGDQLGYSNGMASMTFTMAPDGRSGVGIGGFPPNPQTITRIGASPSPVPAVARREDPYSADNVAKREARSFMTLGKAASRYCSYEDQLKAADNYLRASEIFSKTGDSRLASEATQLHDRALTMADRCEAKKQSSAPQRPVSTRDQSYWDQIAADMKTKIKNRNSIDDRQYCMSLQRELAHKGLQEPMLTKAVQTAERCKQ